MTLKELEALIYIALYGHYKKAAELKEKFGIYSLTSLKDYDLISHYDENPEYIVVTEKGRNVLDILQRVCSI